MEVLLSGLNSYLGTRAASHLFDTEFIVHGIVRNLKVFNARMTEPLNCKLTEVDLIRMGKAYDNYFIDNLSVAYYFTQVHDFADKLTLKLELLSLKNYIFLIKKNKCKRLIYVARLMDKQYISQIEELFKEENLDYTIVLKNIAIGKGSVVDLYIKKLLRFSYIPYVKSVARIRFCPIPVLDVLRFIKMIAIADDFKQKTIGLGGPKEMSFQKLFGLYAKYFSPNTKFQGVILPNFLLDIIHKRLYKVNEEDQLEFSRLLAFETPINNKSWIESVDFTFSSFEEAICEE